MKPLLSSRSNKQSSITLVENGCVISNPSEVAEIFNDHFSNIVQADNSLNPQVKRIIYDQPHHTFQSHLSSNMSGFLKHHFCCSTLLKMSEDWRRSLDKREAVVAVAIDLSKAFDSIDHSLLLAKLGAYGLSSSALHLMSSYLTGRKQRV